MKNFDLIRGTIFDVFETKVCGYSWKKDVLIDNVLKKLGEDFHNNETIETIEYCLEDMRRLKIMEVRGGKLRLL